MKECENTSCDVVENFENKNQDENENICNIGECSREEISEEEESSEDESSEEDYSEEENTETPQEAGLKKDHRIHDQTQYERLYSWLYFNSNLRGYMCKVCEMIYGCEPCPSGRNRGAWSHNAVKFKDNPGKKIRRHIKSDTHRDAVATITKIRIDSNIKGGENTASLPNNERRETNTLYISKLVRIVHFLARNNLAVKNLYPKMLSFLAEELEEPIIKQYLENCPQNASYTSHETCDSFINSIENYLWSQVQERIKVSADIVLFADEASSASKKEMLGIFCSYFDENKKEFHIDFISLVEVSSTKSEIVMDTLEKVLRERDVDITKTRFCCLDGTNSMSGQHSGLQKRIRNHAPHAIYINCRCHRLALCFKHLMNDFPWLQTIDCLLLGLWKTFHFSSKNRYILREIQKAYGMKALNIIKASVTRWLSHGAACKRCRERYTSILGALDDVISKNPKPELIGYRAELLDIKTLLQISFLEDVLTITNTLSLVLQADKKDFGAVRRALKSTVNILENMERDPNSIHLKSLNDHSKILKDMENYSQMNMVAGNTRKRSRIDNSAQADNFHTQICKPFLRALIGKVENIFFPFLLFTVNLHYM